MGFLLIVNAAGELMDRPPMSLGNVFKGIPQLQFQAHRRSAARDNEIAADQIGSRLRQDFAIRFAAFSHHFPCNCFS